MILIVTRLGKSYWLRTGIDTRIALKARAGLILLLGVSSNTQYTMKLRRVYEAHTEENGPQLNSLCSSDGREPLFMPEQDYYSGGPLLFYPFHR